MSYLEQGLFLAGRREFALARIHLRRAVALNPKNTRAAEMLARLPAP